MVSRRDLEETTKINYAEIYNGPNNEYAVGSLKADTVYFFRVAAINDEVWVCLIVKSFGLKLSPNHGHHHLFSFHKIRIQ